MKQTIQYQYEPGDYVLHLGRPRRVVQVLPDALGGHATLVLLYPSATLLPSGTWTGAWGPRGQRRYIAVYVRADTVQPAGVVATLTGGRPRLRRGHAVVSPA